jgi:probable HAF family extracellular repeat protein
MTGETSTATDELHAFYSSGVMADLGTLGGDEQGRCDQFGRA